MSANDTRRASGRRRPAWLALGLAGLLLLWPPAPAAAHETRAILGGKYTMRVGFLEEPAYQGLLNGLYLAICAGTCTTDPATGAFTTGVVGAFETVKAEVSYGGQTMPLPLVAVPRQPGRYEAKFVPTRVGDYTFRIYGELGGERFDERFTSSPTTFDSVQPATAIQFPDKPGYPVGTAPGAPAASAPPSPPATLPATPRPTAPATVAPAASATPATPAATAPAGLAEFQVLRAQLRDQQQQLEAATASATAAATLAIGGLAAGVLGIGVALMALLFASRRRPTPAVTKPTEET